MANSFFVVRRDIMTSLRRSRSQINSDFEAMVSRLRKSPYLLLSESNLKTACNFIAGYDSALRGLPLLGFYHWLVVKGGSSERPRHWIQNLQRLARKEAGSGTSPERVLENGCRIVEKYLAYRRRYGVRKVMADAMNIRKRQIERGARSESSASRHLKAASRMPSNKSLERTREG
jgi:hypothetical protein